MPFDSRFLLTSGVPHLFSRMDVETKSLYKSRYRKFKEKTTALTFGSIAIVDGVQLGKDLLTSKLKAYGYKSIISVAVGPMIQFVSLPIYVFSYASKFRSIAIAMSEIGARITKGEMSIMNWGWFGADIILFGEPVPIYENSTFMLLRNETFGEAQKVFRKLGDVDEL